MSTSFFQFSEPSAWRQALREQILTITDATFESLAMSVFRYQAANNPVYKDYLTHLGSQPDQITSLRAVPFMPIAFFKQHAIITGPPVAAAVTFASSGTTDAVQTSRHYVPDTDLYDTVSRRIFEQAYGPLENVHILALLPSYLERNNSSLVYMVQRFMAHSQQAPGSAQQSGFYLNNLEDLTTRLRQLTKPSALPGEMPLILLIGVTFGLLDWAESGRDLRFLGEYPRLVVMETGGMKGRRKELLREEVHQIMKQRLGVSAVHSEYGMTELLSQAYSPGEGIFHPGPTMRILLRDINDPFEIYPTPTDATSADASQMEEHQTGGPSIRSRQTGERRTGGINVVDLANLDSCAFIETQDLGQYDYNRPNAFRVIGRFDNSDVRGCNLMVV